MTKLQIPKIITKHFPAPTKGIVKTSVIYIGTDKVTNFIDGLAGAPLNKIGMNLPLIGRLDAQDVVTYLIVAGGAKLSMDLIVAFFVTKLLNQGSGLQLPFLKNQLTSGSGGTNISPAVVTTGPGAAIG
jgi:hypothetical protein